jgi:S1-C subfamily serine protease
VNPLDVIAILLLVVAALAGFRSGALPQLCGLAGAVVAAIAALTLLPTLQQPLSALDPLPRAIVVLVALLIAIALGEVVGSAAGRVVGDRLGSGVFGALDDVLGAGVGMLQALLVIWLVGGLLAIGPFTRLAELAQTSAAVRVLDSYLPAPADVAGDVADVLDDTGLPALFVGLEPLPAPPVDRPSDPEAAAIGALGEASTVKVTSSACGIVLTGAGVTVAPGYVVTNAHVIAGATTTRLVLDGATYDAEPVLFDPTFDVAVLRAPRLNAPALRFAAADPDRGTTAAALGYPGGGALTVLPAAVARKVDATGRDIYGSRLVEREVLELWAAIEKGDSGGPLMLADGTIGGLVFAEARTDPEVGYALTPTSVAVHVAPAIGRTEPVDTGDCLG